jgi:dTDP-D-glucose 4,6-dehydratase
MFTHNQIIDAIQGGKKQFVNTFVTDAKFKEELIKLIDAQAQAAKTSVDASLAIAQAFTKNVTEVMKKAVPATK